MRFSEAVCVELGTELGHSILVPHGIRLQAEPLAGIARVSLSALLLADGNGLDSRVLGQFLVEGTAPLPAGPRADGMVVPADAAAAMNAALGQALGRLESQLATTVARR